MNKNILIIGFLFIFSSISFAQEEVEVEPSELEKLIISIQSTPYGLDKSMSFAICSRTTLPSYPPRVALIGLPASLE